MNYIAKTGLITIEKYEKGMEDGFEVFPYKNSKYIKYQSYITKTKKENKVDGYNPILNSEPFCTLEEGDYIIIAPSGNRYVINEYLLPLVEELVEKFK